MGNTVAILGFSVLTNIVNATNFLVMFIALVVIFFLLGMIMGFNINAKKGNSKEEISSEKTDHTKKSKTANALGQDSRESTDRQIISTFPPRNQSNHNHGHRHSRSSRPLE